MGVYLGAVILAALAVPVVLASKRKVFVMKEVSDAQSQMFKQVDMNEFMNLSDKLQDMREDMDDVQEMMMDGMVGDTEIDEDELDRERASISVEPMPTPGMSVPGQQVGPTADPIAPVPSMPAQDNAFNLNDLNTL